MEITAFEFERSAINFLHNTVLEESLAESLGETYDRQKAQATGLRSILFSYGVLFKIREEANVASPSKKETDQWMDSITFLTGLKNEAYIDNLSIDRIRDVLFLIDKGVINSDQKEELDAVFWPFAARAKTHKFWEDLRTVRISNLSSISNVTCLDCGKAQCYTVADEEEGSDLVSLKIFCKKRKALIDEEVRVCNAKIIGKQFKEKAVL